MSEADAKSDAKSEAKTDEKRQHNDKVMALKMKLEQLETTETTLREQVEMLTTEH